MRLGPRLVMAVAVALGSQALGVSITEAPRVFVAPHQVTLTWKTDVPATTEVHFGPSSQATPQAYPRHSAWSQLAGTRHSRTLCNLPVGTYYYRVRSTDSGGASASSAEGSFVVSLPSGSPLDRFVLDGPVYALASHGRTVYFGGSFTTVGIRRGAGLGFDPNGAVFDDTPMVAGEVLSVTPDGAGGFFIGGAFAHVGGLPRRNLAHLLPDLGVDPDWSVDVDGRVLALELSGGALYLGGEFNTIGGSPRRKAAAVSAATGALEPWTFDLNGPVHDLAISGGVVYLGGAFTLANGTVTRNRAAAVDATTAALSPWDPNLNGAAYAVAVGNGAIYLGGAFTSTAGSVRNFAAAFDPSGTRTGWNPNVDAAVMDLAVSGSTVYLGGLFTNANGNVPRSRAAAVDATTGAVTPWNPNVYGTVRAMAVGGGTVYLGGVINAVGSVPRRQVAAIDALTGAVTPWDPKPNDTVDAIALSGGTIYLGGRFSAANGGTARANAAALDASTGELAAWNPRPGATVRALAANDTTVFIGGEFTNLNGGIARSHLAATDALSGDVTAFNPSPDGEVRALDLSNGTLYLGGLFSGLSGGVSRNRAAAVSATTGAPTAWDPDLDDLVTTLTVEGGTVYLGGEFTLANKTVPRSYAAAVDSVSGSLSAWDPSPSGPVSTMSIGGGLVYLGGGFASVGGVARGRAAAIGIATGAPTPWNPAFNFSVFGLAVSGGALYATGFFTTAQGTARAHLAAFDTTTGGLASWAPPAFDDDTSIPAAAVLPMCGLGKVFFGGTNFLGVGTTPQTGLLTLDCAPSSVPGARLAFTTPPRTFTAGACAGAGGAIRVELQGSAGQPVGAARGGQALVASSTSAGTVKWYQDSACSTEAVGGAFHIPGGSSAVSLYYQDTAAGTPTLSVTNPSGLSNPPGQVHTVVAAPAARLVLSGVASPRGVGELSDVTVLAEDAFGNRATGYAGTIAFSSTDAAATLPAQYTFAPGPSGDDGQRTFPASVAFGTPGRHRLTVSDFGAPAVSGAVDVEVVQSASFHLQLRLEPRQSAPFVGSLLTAQVDIGAEGPALPGELRLRVRGSGVSLRPQEGAPYEEGELLLPVALDGSGAASLALAGVFGGPGEAPATVGATLERADGSALASAEASLTPARLSSQVGCSCAAPAGSALERMLLAIPWLLALARRRRSWTSCAPTRRSRSSPGSGAGPRRSRGGPPRGRRAAAAARWPRSARGARSPPAP